MLQAMLQTMLHVNVAQDIAHNVTRDVARDVACVVTCDVVRDVMQLGGDLGKLKETWHIGRDRIALKSPQVYTYNKGCIQKYKKIV